MKTNLDTMYKTNTSLESTGVWFEINDDTAFLLKRFGGTNAEAVKRAMATHYKPHARRIENGTLSTEKEDEIMAKVFVEACLLDWRGVVIEDEEKECEKDLAVKFFMALPELRLDLFNYATSAESYKETLGNS